MLKTVQRFGEHCSYHLQGEYINFGGFGEGGEFDFMVLIDGALYKSSKNAQPLHIHTEGGNCNVYRNVGQFSTFYEISSQACLIKLFQLHNFNEL